MHLCVCIYICAYACVYIYIHYMCPPGTAMCHRTTVRVVLLYASSYYWYCYMYPQLNFFFLKKMYLY